MYNDAFHVIYIHMVIHSDINPHSFRSRWCRTVRCPRRCGRCRWSRRGTDHASESRPTDCHLAQHTPQASRSGAQPRPKRGGHMVHAALTRDSQRRAFYPHNLSITPCTSVLYCAWLCSSHIIILCTSLLGSLYIYISSLFCSVLLVCGT